MFISSLHLRNFRMFGEVDLKLNRELCVFVGDNGSGKTTLLDALALLVSRIFPYCDYVPRIGAIPYSSLNPRKYVEIKNGRVQERTARDSFILAEISPLDEVGNYSKTGSSYALYAGKSPNRLNVHHQFGIKHNRTESDLAEEMNHLAEEGKSIPALAYYGPHRGAQQDDRKRFGRRKRNYTDPFSAYLNALQPSLDFDSFLDWFNAEEANELREQRKDRKFFSRELGAVREALERVFQNVELKLTNPRFEMNPKRFVMDQHMPDGSVKEMRFDQFSDGYRGIVALVADFARRLALCNRFTMENPLEAGGILLIDEVDVHLHPKWQYRVVGDLRRTFPNVQLIVTTHSAEVLSSVKKEHIYILRVDQNGVLREEHPHDETMGYYPDSIAAEVMNTPELYRETPGFRAYLDCLAELQTGQIDGQNYKKAYEVVVDQYGQGSPLCEELRFREEGVRRARKLRERLEGKANDETHQAQTD